MKYRVLIEQDEEGIFVAEVPSLPGCISQGNTRKQALNNIQEAISVYLESLKAYKAYDEPVPPPIYEEISAGDRNDYCSKSKRKCYFPSSVLNGCSPFE